ncbi:unnamed protein product [Mucor hiemalis]
MQFKLFSLGVVVTMIVTLTCAVPLPQPGVEVADIESYIGQYSRSLDVKRSEDTIDKRSDEEDENEIDNDNESDFDLFGGEA